MRVFTLDDQRSFARLSGDHNPLHVDPVTARRLLFGEAVVHGVHQLLWALDQAATAARGGLEPLAWVKAQFLKPLGLNVPARAIWRGDRCDVEAGGQITARIEARFARLDGFAKADEAEPPAGAPTDREWTAAAGAEGEIPLMAEPALATRLFPQLVHCLPRAQMAALLAATRVVGMECPGRHSLFTGLEMAFTEPASSPGRLAWRVDKADERFRAIHISLSAPGISGRLSTHLRPAPIPQPAARDLAGLVADDLLAGASVLVIGGSRGLGEVAAKMAAMAGAAVCVTHSAGRDDAERVVADIRSAGARADRMALDVTRPEIPPDRPALPPFTHVLYFAAPRIRPGAPDRFDPELFDGMARFFVSGFFASMTAVRPLCAPAPVILYPSTIFIDQGHPKFKEYAAAKAAGEALFRPLSKIWPGIAVLSPRLPRVRTDQTAGIVAETLPEPSAILRKVLSDLAAAASPSSQEPRT